jgi:hypothetical protein
MSSLGERPLHDQELLDDASTEEMLLDDSLEHRRITLSVPRAFWIDDGDRSAVTDAQAVHLAAKHAAVLRQPELAESPFEELPGSEATGFLAAFRVGLVATEKNMPARDTDADDLCCGALTF